MSAAMVTVRLDPGHRTLRDAAARLGLDVAELDPEFGLVAVDPEAGFHTVRVSAGAAARIEPGPDVEGPFPDEPVEGFGHERE